MQKLPIVWYIPNRTSVWTFFFLSSPNMASQIISFFYLQERMEPETSVIWLCSKNNWGNTLILSTFLKDYKFYLKFWDKVTP